MYQLCHLVRRLIGAKLAKETLTKLFGFSKNFNKVTKYFAWKYFSV